MDCHASEEFPRFPCFPLLHCSFKSVTPPSSLRYPSLIPLLSLSFRIRETESFYTPEKRQEKTFQNPDLSFKNRSLCHVEHCSPPPNGGAKRGLKRSRNISLILFRCVVRPLDCARGDRANENLNDRLYML